MVARLPPAQKPRRADRLRVRTASRTGGAIPIGATQTITGGESWPVSPGPSRGPAGRPVSNRAPSPGGTSLKSRRPPRFLTEDLHKGRARPACLPDVRRGPHPFGHTARRRTRPCRLPRRVPLAAASLGLHGRGPLPPGDLAPPRVVAPRRPPPEPGRPGPVARRPTTPRLPATGSCAWAAVCGGDSLQLHSSRPSGSSRDGEARWCSLCRARRPGPGSLQEKANASPAGGCSSAQPPPENSVASLRSGSRARRVGSAPFPLRLFPFTARPAGL